MTPPRLVTLTVASLAVLGQASDRPARATPSPAAPTGGGRQGRAGDDNMCVLRRSFAIKQVRRWGVDCLLVRDVTDAMYNPRMRPIVSHDEGTELVIRYTERHWCPSVEAKALAGPAK
jgi:hypothetical protein